MKKLNPAPASLTYSEVIGCLNSPEYRGKHRAKYTDLQWAEKQPKGPPKYRIGDVVEFHVGGFGVIDEVQKPQSGWPSEYSTSDIDGLHPHKDGVCAWHYEGDFKRHVINPAIRKAKKVFKKS